MAGPMGRSGDDSHGYGFACSVKSQMTEEFSVGDLVHAITFHNCPLGIVIQRKISSCGKPMHHYDILVCNEMAGFHALSLRRALVK